MDTPPSIITSPQAPDVAAVRKWMEEAIAALRFRELVVAVIWLITRLRDLNTELTRKVAESRRARPRSETLERLERQLVLPFIAAAMAATAPAVVDDGASAAPKNKPSRRGRHPGRAALPAHLRRVVVQHSVPPEMRKCPLCAADMTTVGHDTCEKLQIRPAELYVEKHETETVACPAHDTIVSAPTQPAIVERGVLGDTLIVEALCDKYLEHQPIERQCRRWRRAGVDIAPQTLGRSVATAIDLLTPIACRIREMTRGAEMLATDATGFPVLDRDAPDGIRTGTVWCWVGDERWVTFIFTPVGDAASVRDFLGADVGRPVQCDGTNTMSFIEREGGQRPGCWSHGRRRFVEAARAGDALAVEALKKMRRFFAVERLSALHADDATQRLARRREYSAPVIIELRAWLDEHRATIPPKTPLGRALGYLHRQWRRLTLFLEDGRFELTNNRVERELRPLVLGRKNWLFAMGDLGGARTTAILTVIATCIAHRVNPRAYLHLVAKMLVDGWLNTRLDELLPHRMAELHPDLSLPECHDLPRLPADPAVPS